MKPAKGQWLIELYRSFTRTVISGIVCEVRIAQAFEELLNRHYYLENVLPTSIWVGRQNLAKKFEDALTWFLGSSDDKHAKLNAHEPKSQSHSESVDGPLGRWHPYVPSVRRRGILGK